MSKKNEKKNQDIIDSFDYLSSAASTWDCTGLIPASPSERAELEAYEDLYHFLPPSGKASDIRPEELSDKKRIY